MNLASYESIVYYRVFAGDKPLACYMMTAGDPFLGRIKARNVVPPHNASSIIRCLSRSEKINGSTSSLFLTSSSQSSMDEYGKMSILQYDGPGSTPQEPLILRSNFDQQSLDVTEDANGDNGSKTSESHYCLLPSLVVFFVG